MTVSSYIQRTIEQVLKPHVIFRQYMLNLDKL